MSFGIFLICDICYNVACFVPFLGRTCTLPTTLVNICNVVGRCNLGVINNPINNLLSSGLFRSPAGCLHVNCLVATIILVTFA